jgi:hypothetical protein
MAVTSACEKVACMALAVQTVLAAPHGGCRRLALCQGRTTGKGPPSALVAKLRKSVRPSWREGGFFILAVLDKEGLYKADTQGGYRPDGPIAQLDRVTDFYSVGCRFESCWDRQRLQLEAEPLIRQ